MKNLPICIWFTIACAVATLYAQQPLSSLEKSTTDIFEPAATSLRSGNAVVAVQVNDTLGGSENRYKGLFSIGTADNRPLLYLFPQARYSSHFNVRVDGVVYSNDPVRTSAQPLFLVSNPLKLSDGTITCSYRAGAVNIEQRLTPEQYTSTTGAIRIKYVITNQDATTAHQVGLLLFLDTFIIRTDEARVSTSMDYSRLERDFKAPLIPDYFQAFENDDPLMPGVVAQGTLVGNEAVRPDLMIIGDVSTLPFVQWDYTLQNPYYNDSGVILRWNEKRLAAGDSSIIATYYGIGDVSTTGGPLALNLTAPNRLQAVAGQLTTNPFDINLIVTNAGGTTANYVQATLTLPQGLTLVSGDFASKLVSPALAQRASATASWKVLAQCPMTDTTLTFSVNVTATNPLSNSVSRQIFIPSCASSLPSFTLNVSPRSQIVTAGQAKSYTVRMQPSGGFTDNVSLSLFPSVPGVTPSFVPSVINAATTSTLTLQTAKTLVPGNYPFVLLGKGGGITRSDTISLIVQAAPLEDKTPPFTTNHNPARNARNVPLTTDIAVEVYDAQSDVDSAALRMTIAGVTGTTNITRIRNTPKAYRLRFQPATPFRDNQTVQVQINAADLASPPNPMTPDIYSLTTVRDSLPPFTSGHRPAKGATNVPLDTDLQVEVRDNLAGVDSASLKMEVNGQFVTPLITHTSQGYVLHYKPSQSFRYNSTVQVIIFARDLARPANEMEPDTLRFATIRDVEWPFTTDHQPAKGAQNVPMNTGISLHIRDLIAGVDSASIVLTVNGTTVSPQISGTPRDYTLQYNPPQDFTPGQTVEVSIVAADLSFPPNVMPAENYSFSISIVKDTSPPYTVNHAPAPGATNVSPNTTISVEVRDNLSGVDSTSIVMKVNGNPVSVKLERRAQGYVVQHTPTTSFALNDTVWVSFEASDRAIPPNVMKTDEYFFVTLRDISPPFTSGHRPAKGATNVPLDTDIHVEIRDELAGVDPASLAMEVNGQPVSPTITPATQGYLLQYQPAQKFRYNSIIQVVIRARDLARPANEMIPDTLRFSTIHDVEPPFTTDHQPAKTSTNAPPYTNISLHLRDLVSGVDHFSIVMTVNGAPVSPTLTGNPNDYELEYDPPKDFLSGDTVRVSIAARDFSFPPNVMPAETYFFVIQQLLPDLAVTGLGPVGELVAGLPGEVIGEIANTGSADVSRAFTVQFRVDGVMRKDTTFNQLFAGERATLRLPLRFQTTGTHEVELVVDVGDKIREVTEANNSQKLVIQISQTPAQVSRLTVRPNPFTPNNDGFNDQVVFDYSNLGLRNPSLQIFDANGVPVWSSHEGLGGRFTWNGRDDRGRDVIPGVYLYTLRDLGNNVASGYVVVAR
ncbi:MAG: gliding motility-associated C-terminal domain-containing protein [candidate division KSB1 bacterium]|nr:gliding motility-associated C-terminal domain-containing protein [candidate division KSB1 bacterium]MDZ7301591.1 gliding motility-associated C-terminal domain-containing protein [candidate division KSB1 bacterium]MDZ7310993.1 gliding motility-associated C-terminal domain-containing protein [candidate division KSB1 bacterium]